MDDGGQTFLDLHLEEEMIDTLFYNIPSYLNLRDEEYY